MPTLDELIANKRAEIADLKERLKNLGNTTVIRGGGRVRSLRDALQADPGLTIIPELKKADPWRGLLHERFQPLEFAQSITEAGAAALAIQTDERFFQGSLEDLQKISRRMTVPVLMRDFVIDDVQITDGKAKGADSIVLMAELLDDKELAGFMQFADFILMEAVVEVSNEADLERAIQHGATTIAVQNRNLRNMETHADATVALASKIPADVCSIAVGGVTEPGDLAAFRDAGFDGAIVGDLLLRAEDPAARLAECLGIAKGS